MLDDLFVWDDLLSHTELNCLQVAQLERAHTRLKSDLALQAENSLAQKDLRESRGQVSELTAQVERAKAELSSLEKEHRSLK